MDEKTQILIREVLHELQLYLRYQNEASCRAELQRQAEFIRNRAREDGET